ncbi:MAG: HAMP domain-containing sensor histidine kinase [Elusimicrobia bacterium]|nr:HAMP domain-containing sensor histidine kinase [Elusimicrobiota bacterium]
MEFLAIVFIPMILLLLGAAFLVVSQVSGFVQSGSLNQRQYVSNMIIQQYMAQIAMAQSQIFQRNRELEVLSSKLVFSNQELSRLNDMKSKFLSMVVHEVRTPLGSIRGFTELLLKRGVGEKEEQYLKNIVLSSDQMGRLIADLTDLAIIEAGKLKMEKAVFDYADIARDILPGVSINAQKKGVELSVGELPADCRVNGDKFRLSQVLMNLLNNAIKFTPAGKRVELTMRREGRYLAAYVKDSGIGIHPSETKRIFEKFYQAKYQKDEKLRKQGWGLGLAIAQEVVKAHKGDIGVTSPGLGKGSTFWFKVPVGV